MSVAELPFQIDREKIAAFCRAHGIRKSSLFGSASAPGPVRPPAALAAIGWFRANSGLTHA